MAKVAEGMKKDREPREAWEPHCKISLLHSGRRAWLQQVLRSSSPWAPSIIAGVRALRGRSSSSALGCVRLWYIREELASRKPSMDNGEEMGAAVGLPLPSHRRQTYVCGFSRLDSDPDLLSWANVTALIQIQLKAEPSAYHPSLYQTQPNNRSSQAKNWTGSPNRLISFPFETQGT